MLEQILLNALARYEARIDGEIGVRSSRCGRCGNAATLRTARVRKQLRICFAFVVPLGTRVQVDQCSECGKTAFDVDVGAWERLRAAAFAAAGAEIARPDAHPERWLDEHRARVVFGDEAGASDLAHQLAGDPRATARLFAGLAWTEQWQGHYGSAGQSMQAAERLCAPNAAPLAEFALAEALDVGDADAALVALRRLDNLGDLHQGTLRRLLDLLVARRRARELSDLLGRLLHAFPHAAYDADVRRAARFANARTDGARPIVLPRLPGEYRKRNLAAAFLVLVVLGFVAAEVRARLDRTVWFASSRNAAFEVAVDGAHVLSLGTRTAQRLGLAYGTHEITITGARDACFELVLAPRGGLALLDDRIHVVDVSGDTILRVTPPNDEHTGAPIPPSIAYGRDVHAFDGVDRAFGAQRTAHEVPMPAKETTVALEMRSALTLAMEEAAVGRNRAALALLTDRIARDPDRDDLDLAMAWTAADCGAGAEAMALLAPKLARVPFATKAHDAARYVLQEPDAERLRADYEARHAAPSGTESATAALLRAHLSTTRAEALTWLERARAADPIDVRVLRHSADLAAGFDWNAALAFAQAGLAIAPHDAFLLDIRSGARMALGALPELEQELRAELGVHPRDQERQGRLAELLVVTNRSTELDLFVGEAERRGGGPKHAQRLRVLALEAGGRLEELAASPFDPRDEERTRWQVLALCELGRARDFGARLGRERRLVDRWYDALAIDLCFRLVDDERNSRPWRARALHRLARHSAQMRVVELLEAETASTPEDVMALALGAHETAVVLLAEAERARGPERAAWLAAAARFHPWPGHVQRLARRLASDS